ncbi:unnamed protein product [Moneuplotes crassus]|uniref:Uncharacterized protein n=2 Tax=Euplotes crassus TaxID=5936 RepID=A0AAD2DAG6_EUPCR|nr:unnamed protein product [Moneuplotes crassus]
MKYGELIEACIDIIKSFNPIVTTLDSHADDFTKNMENAFEKVFIKQVFYGCVRYQEFLKLFNQVLFKIHSSSTNRNDATLYSIFSYLTLFRLEELQIDDYKKIVYSQDAVKMHVFLQFIFNAEALREHVRDDWIQLYDYTYIDDKIIGGVERMLPNVADVLATIEKKATGHIASSLTQSSFSIAAAKSGDETMAKTILEDSIVKKKAPTQPKPFKLTKPKPKVIEEPEAIKRETKAIPLPKHIFKKSLADIEKEKQERRKNQIERVRKDYEKGKVQPFKLKTKETNYDIEKVKEKFQEEDNKKYQFDKKHARKLPDFNKNEPEIKPTAAAILREGHQLTKKRQEEEKILKDFEMNMRDASEFDRWSKEMAEKEEVERLEHMQKKKIEMELARHEAIEVKKQKHKENQFNAAKMKVEADMREDQRHHEKVIDQENKKELISMIHDQRVVAGDEKEKIVQKNKEIRDQVHEEISEALAKRRAEEEAELRKREELIRQIRQLEKIPIVRTQGFDPTETAGHGVLNEMSIAELRERLEYEKIRREAETEERRKQNLQGKAEKEDMLKDTSDQILIARSELRNQKDKEREEKKRKKEELERKRQEERERGLREAHRRIAEKKRIKKEEDDRLAAELRKIKLQREYLNAKKMQMEKKVKKDLEAGLERQERDKRNAKLLEEYKRTQVKVKDMQVNARNNKTKVQGKLDYDKGYKERLETRKMENEILHKEVLGYKNTKYAKQKIQEETLKTKQHKMNPFKDKINKQSIDNATKIQRRKQGVTTTFHATKEMAPSEEDFDQMDEDTGGLLAMEDEGNEQEDQVNKMMEMEA